jgi:3-isopropylmalate/(R)-2-methylmalate dehydratase small subunit
MIDEVDRIEVDFTSGIIMNTTKHQTYNATPLPDFVRGIVDAGGLIEFAKKLVE